MTYQEIKNRLTKCELALSKIKDGTYSSTTSLAFKSAKQKLQILKESYIKLLKEVDGEIGDDGFVSTDDKDKAADLAKDGVKVKLTSEQEGITFSVQETKAVAKEVGRALIEALREAGDEIETIKAHHIEENSFEVYVKYKSDFEDEFTFDIRDDKLHLVDFSFDKELVDVGVKPSGEAIINVDVLKNELLKHFKSLNEVEINEEETDRQKYLRMLDMYKRSSGENRKNLKSKVEKAADLLGIKLQLSEAPEGLFYLKVDIRDARKAIDILDDKYRKQVEFSGSDTYYFGSEDTAYDAMMDFSANDIVVSDTNLDLFAEENVKEESDLIKKYQQSIPNYPRLALNILNKNKKEIGSIYDKYKGQGQDANMALKRDLMALLQPDIDNVNVPEDKKELVMKYIKMGLASHERASIYKAGGISPDTKIVGEVNINPEAEKYVKRFIAGVAKRYGYDEMDAVHLIYQVLSNTGYLDMRLESINERVGALQDFINLIRDRAIDSEFSEQEEALEVIEALADHYGIKIQTGGFVGEGIHDRDVLSRPLSNPAVGGYKMSPKMAKDHNDDRSYSAITSKYRKQINDPSISDEELEYILGGSGNPRMGGTPNAIKRVIQDRNKKSNRKDVNETKGQLNEYTDDRFKGSEVIDDANKRGPDMFGKQIFADLLPKGVASENDAVEALKAHDKSPMKARMGQYAPMFVHLQYHDLEHEGEKYRMHQTQYYNSNFEDKDPSFNPGVSKITLFKITKPALDRRDREETDELGTIIVKTDQYVQDLRNLPGLGKRVSETAPGYKHDCAAHVVHETYGHGMCIPEKHTLIKEGNKYVVTHYDVVFKKDKKVVRDIPVNELKIITQNEHWHKGYKKKKKK